METNRLNNLSEEHKLVGPTNVVAAGVKTFVPCTSPGVAVANSPTDTSASRKVRENSWCTEASES